MDPNADIRKFAEFLVKAGREGVAWERKKLEWILQQKKAAETGKQS
ncbi:MAG TPA: hypothetical protein VGN16_18100 [Acidobacteriaceae bacterium]|jgi:hypothetical protein